MNKENRNDEAVSPVIATILMVAITVVLAGVLYVWASSLAEGNTDGDLSLYVFDGEDAGGSQPSTETDDNLIRITMTQGGDIQWSAISVKIEVDGEAPVTCDNPGQDGTGQCVLVEFGDDTDTVLTAGDGFTIKENGQDLCSSSCSIDITITDTRQSKIIDETDDIVAE